MNLQTRTFSGESLGLTAKTLNKSLPLTKRQFESTLFTETTGPVIPVGYDFYPLDFSTSDFDAS